MPFSVSGNANSTLRFRGVAAGLKRWCSTDENMRLDAALVPLAATLKQSGLTLDVDAENARIGRWNDRSF